MATHALQAFGRTKKPDTMTTHSGCLKVKFLDVHGRSPLRVNLSFFVYIFFYTGYDVTLLLIQRKYTNASVFRVFLHSSVISQNRFLRTFLHTLLCFRTQLGGFGGKMIDAVHCFLNVNDIYLIIINNVQFFYLKYYSIEQIVLSER